MRACALSVLQEVEKDLTRTFPKHEIFNKQAGLDALRRSVRLPVLIRTDTISAREHMHSRLSVSAPPTALLCSCVCSQRALRLRLAKPWSRVLPIDEFRRGDGPPAVSLMRFSSCMRPAAALMLCLSASPGYAAAAL